MGSSGCRANRDSSLGFCNRKDVISGYFINLRCEIRSTLTLCGLVGRPLRIYKVLTVAFLSSGTTLRPILAKSQCWCVDGDSKFVLRVANNSYYRIELPNTCPAEDQKVEEFKGVLAKLLQYELTPCPFKRGFTVDLPEPPKTPVRLRPWRPRPRPQPVTLGTPGADIREYKVAKDSNLQEQETEGNSSSKDNNAIFDSGSLEGYKLSNSDMSSAAGSDLYCETSGDPGPTAETSDAVDYEEPDSFKTPIQPKPLRTGRNITAPPQLSLRTPPPSSNTTTKKTSLVHVGNGSSLSSSSDSFHSFHSPLSPLPPSPPYSNPSSPFTLPENEGLKLRRTRSFKWDTSREENNADFPGVWDMTSPEPAEEMDISSPTFPKTPTHIGGTASQNEDIWPEAITPSPATELRSRRPVSPPRRQTPSPLPLPANLYSPGCHLSGHHLTTAILQKTCSLLLGPPVQLVALMLNIASKIAKGAYRGASFGYGESGQKIPCSWDFSDAEEDYDSDPGWGEDDFGVSLGAHLTNPRNVRAQKVGASWEID